MDDLLEQMQPIFREVLEQPDLVLQRGTNASNVANWDSLAHIELIELLELKFKVKFTLSELEKTKNVGDLADLVAAKRLAR